MNMLRILVLIDEPSLRRTVTQAFADTPGFSVIASVTSCEDALAALDRKLAFEVAIVDLALPGKCGTCFLTELSRKRSDAAAIVLTGKDDGDSIFAALKAGARGYLLKSTPMAELVSAVREVISGGAPMTPAVARLVVGSFSARPRVNEGAALTPREHDVLRLLVEGKRYEVVAHELGVGLGTIQTHVKSLYKKLAVTSKAEAAAVALRKGLV